MQSALQHIPSFYLTQKIAVTVNRFEVRERQLDGEVGRLICFAQQKRMAFKEEVTFYADEARTHPVFSFKARNVMELNGKYDVFDQAGNQLAFFRKNWQASLLRSTFEVEGPGYTGTGQERNMAVAILRRIGDIPFLSIHFDYTDSSGAPLVSIERQATLRDKYTVTVPDSRIDFRVAAALAVGMDVLLQR